VESIPFPEPHRSSRRAAGERCNGENTEKHGGLRPFPVVALRGTDKGPLGGSEMMLGAKSPSHPRPLSKSLYTGQSVGEGAANR
jgi:hypothetical protein